MSDAKTVAENLSSLLETAEFGGYGAPYRDYKEVKADYDQIALYADEKDIPFDKAAAHLKIKFTSADKWVMVRQGVEDSGLTLNVNDVARGLRFKYSQTEKRVRILILLRDCELEGEPSTIYDIIERWLFPPTILDQTMRMGVYLSILMRDGNETEAKNASGYLSHTAVAKWKELPEFKVLYKAAIDRSIVNLEDQLKRIANSTEYGAPQVAALKLLLERSERQRLGDLYDSLDAEGRKKELVKKAFIFAAEKGANLKDALKLIDPETYGGLDDVNVNLSPELMNGINPEAPTHLLLEMQKMLAQFQNTTVG